MWGDRRGSARANISETDYRGCSEMPIDYKYIFSDGFGILKFTNLNKR